MGTPGWRHVATKTVPDEKGRLWTVAVEYVTPGRLYKLAVAKKDGKEQMWKPNGGDPCSADGNPAATRAAALPIADARVGALIGRIGGSTADGGAVADRVLPFSVGRHCVIQAPDASSPKIVGSLYLGINDIPGGAANLDGSLEVEIFEAL